MAAGYNISAAPVIVGGADGVIEVTKPDGEAAKGVSVYTVDGDNLIGVTNEAGKLVTSMFNSTAGAYPVYAKDQSGMLSFQYKVMTYDAQCNKDGSPQTVRFNVVSDPTTEKNITWLSNPLNKGEQVIRYAPAGTDNWTEVAAESKLTTFVTGGNKIANINSALITGLTPDTEYDYIIGTEEAFSEKAAFTTDAEGRTDTEFFVIGDIQTTDKTNLEAIVDKLTAEGKSYDFGVQTGDAVDQGKDFADWNSVGAILGAGKLGGTNMINIMGNHEYYGDPDTVVASAMYNNPNTAEGGYYSVEYGNIYIATINFANTAGKIREAAEWLAEDAAKSKATWKILCSHQPPYFTNYSGGNDPVYAMIPDAVEAGGIDVVFSGHDHSVARTNSLKDDKQVEDNGTIYYICGSTGGKVYPITTQGRFDYDEIFKYVSADYKAIYLTASANENEMTINLYDLKDGLIDTVTIQTECYKHGHSNIYNPETDTVACERCGEEVVDYTGEVSTDNGDVYYLINGVKQTGWVPVGEEFIYCGDTGIKEVVTSERTEKDCVTDTTVTYTAESGAVKVHRFNDAGGHEYEEENGELICTVCGHKRVNLEDCKYELSYEVCTYNGGSRHPVVTVTAPDGTVLERGKSKDYVLSYKQNTDVGQATIKVTATKVGKYVNINDWRGNCAGTFTLHFTILPDAPANVLAKYQNNKVSLYWDEAMQADQYLIRKSVDGKKWSDVGTTSGTKYTVTGLDTPSKYRFRVYSKKLGTDGVMYKSNKYGTAQLMAPTVKAYTGSVSGDPILMWEKVDGVKYTVYRSTSQSGKYTKIFETTGGSLRNVSAVRGETYYYKVKATLIDENVSATSEVYKLTAKCAKPELTGMLRESNGKPRVRWNAINGAVKYELYRSTSGKSGTFTKLITTKGRVITNKSAVKGKTYYYKVRAVSSNGVKGNFSNVVKLKSK